MAGRHCIIGTRMILCSICMAVSSLSNVKDKFKSQMPFIDQHQDVFFLEGARQSAHQVILKDSSDT